MDEKMSKQLGRCDKCKWWESIAEATGDDPANEPTGWCKRHAPSPYLRVIYLVNVWKVQKHLPNQARRTCDKDGNLIETPGLEPIHWPETEPDDYCGEFTRRKRNN